MTTLTTLPNLSRSFQLMKLTDDLLDKANRNTLRGLGIALLLEANTNKEQVVSIIKNEVQKYPDQMSEIIGADLVKRLKEFE